MERRLKKVAIRWAKVSFVAILCFWLIFWIISGKMPLDTPLQWDASHHWNIPASRLFDAFIGPIWVLLISWVCGIIRKKDKTDPETDQTIVLVVGCIPLLFWLCLGLVTGILGFIWVILVVLALCLAMLLIYCAMYLIATPFKLFGQFLHKNLIIPGIRRIGQSPAGPKIAQAINYLTGND